MPITLEYETMKDLLLGAAAEIRAHHEDLSRLDSVGGDGDHGSTMVRAMTRLEEAVAACAVPTMKALLYDVGWAILGVDGGAAGSLFGALFMGMSEYPDAKEALDAPALAAIFEAGLANVQRQTKAQPGDKTLMDALVPAVAALRAAAVEDVEIPVMLERAAAAAAEGAASTASMQARFGRARNIKEKSIGYQDAGAVSTSLLFKGFSKGLYNHA